MKIFVKAHTGLFYVVVVPPAHQRPNPIDFHAHDFAAARCKRAGVEWEHTMTEDPEQPIVETFTDDGLGLEGLWS